MKVIQVTETVTTPETGFDSQALRNRVLSEMPDEERLYDLAELFKVFGDTTRIRILYVLFEAEMCVCDINMQVAISLLFIELPYLLNSFPFIDIYLCNDAVRSVVLYKFIRNHIYRCKSFFRFSLQCSQLEVGNSAAQMLVCGMKCSALGVQCIVIQQE